MEGRSADIRLAIIGTQVLYCPGDVLRAGERIEWSLRKLQPGIVISGGAPGVDTIAEEVAREEGYSEEAGTLRILRPKVERWHPDGYRDRNTRIAMECTHLLRVFCAYSTTYGSGWTYDLAERLGRQVVRHRVCEE